jgi:hypothetical protein
LDHAINVLLMRMSAKRLLAIGRVMEIVPMKVYFLII